MNKSFYFFGIFYLGLFIASGLFQSIIYFQLDAQFFGLQSFAEWFLVVNIISLIGSLFILKYYHYKKYWFIFSSGTIAAIATLCHFIAFYILMVAGELESYFIPTFFLASGAGIIYAISLIFSYAAKRFWLKTAGIFMLTMYLVLVSAFIWSLFSQEIRTSGTSEKISQWASLAGNLLAVLFIMNFLSEVRLLKTENSNTPMRKSLENTLALVGVITFILTFAVGLVIANESYGLLSWNSRLPERVQELARPFEARIYVNSKGDTMRYRLLKPLDYDPKKKYPLVVCLHHGGAHGTDNVKQVEASEPAPLLSKDVNRRNYPAFIFVPQCPPGSSWGGIPNYPSIDSLVFETINRLEEEFEIDVKRLYVTGTSGGGYGSWHFICTRPKMFAAAIPMCGRGDPNLAQNIVAVPVWAFHGRKDRLAPVKLSREMIKAIKKAGGNPRYTEFPNAGHNIWNQVNDTPGLLDWLFAQKRD